MARGIRRTAPTQLEDIIRLTATTTDSMSTFKDDRGLTYISDMANSTTAVHSFADDIKKLEQDIAELSLRVSKPRRRIKSIRIRF